MQIKLHIETDQEVLKDVMVENNENDFYKEIGSVLPDLKTESSTNALCYLRSGIC